MGAVVVEDLSKVYRSHRKEAGVRGSLASLFRREMRETRAVSAVSFTIAAGEIVGFLGPNGAGKTTTLKMLCGLLYPSGGAAMVLGHIPSRREPEYLRRIALVMGQKNMLWWDIPALETLILHKEMYGLEEAAFKRTVDELANILDVGDLLRVQVRKLSLGERMKMELLTALVHRPDVLFLDEPTIGLDVVAQQRVRDFLRQLNREYGTTILLTSHYMDDIEQLCPRVLVIDHGRLHFDGTLAMLVERAAPHKRVVAVFAEPIARAAAEAALAGLCAGPLVGDDTAGDVRLSKISLAVPREAVADVAGRLLQLGRVVDLAIEEEPVEEIVRAIFQPDAARGSDAGR